MQTNAVCTWLLGAIVGGSLAGCVLYGDEQPTSDDQLDGTANEESLGGIGSGMACELLEGHHYRTVEPQTDCGPAPAGLDLECFWSIRFSPATPRYSEYVHHYSDISLTEYAQCAGGNLFHGKLHANGAFIGTYEADGSAIVWEGIVYARQ